MKILPVVDTVRQSMMFCFVSKGTLVRLASMPFILSLALYCIFIFMSDRENTVVVGELSMESAVLYLIDLLAFMVLIPFATAWHRHLLAPESVGWFSYHVGRREIRYLLVFIAVSAIFYIGFPLASAIFAVIMLILDNLFPLSNIGAIFAGIGVICIGFVAVFVVVRFLMTFPASAIGAPAGFKDSWRATKGHVLNMSGIYIIIALVSLLAYAPFLYVGFQYFSSSVIGDVWYEMAVAPMDEAIVNIFFLPLEFIVAAVTVSCLSLIYKFLSSQDDASAHRDQA